MSDVDNPPIDAFAGLDLEDFKLPKKQERPAPARPKVEKEVIRATAEKEAFVSRQAVASKQKIVPKTFSLFQDECDLINEALRAYQTDPDIRLSQPSSSDVVRAALHAFATLTAAEQAQYIKENRGRGRR